MSNPDPARITNPMWKLWEQASIIIPGVKLSGIYADKDGYHNTVTTNKKKWPNNYSIKLSLDLDFGNYDKARGIDLTMSTAEMIKWTSRMKASALNFQDHRLAAVREFYGTLDGVNVYGLIKDAENSTWRRSTSDSSHLWHGHTSIFAAFVNNWSKLSPLVSVWRGDTLEEWSNEMSLPKQGDSGEEVKSFQYIHNLVKGTSPAVTIDGDYGPATVAAFTDFAKKHGAVPTYNAVKITGWLNLQYQAALIKHYIPAPTPPVLPPPVDVEIIKSLVNDWLAAYLGDKLKFTGTLDGIIEV